jgi:hypothetical protein
MSQPRLPLSDQSPPWEHHNFIDHAVTGLRMIWVSFWECIQGLYWCIEPLSGFAVNIWMPLLLSCPVSITLRLISLRVCDIFSKQREIPTDHGLQVAKFNTNLREIITTFVSHWCNTHLEFAPFVAKVSVPLPSPLVFLSSPTHYQVIRRGRRLTPSPSNNTHK